MPRYEALYPDGAAYAPRWYQRRITGQVHELAAEYGMGPARSGQHRSPRADRADAGADPAPGPGAAQLTLL